VRKIPTVWAIPLSLAATDGIEFSFSSSRYLDVSVPWVSHVHLCIQCTLIQESRDQRSFDNSPRLIAVFHALHRLLMPRHPPCALNSLTTNIQSSSSHSSRSDRQDLKYQAIGLKRPPTSHDDGSQWIRSCNDSLENGSAFALFNFHGLPKQTPKAESDHYVTRFNCVVCYEVPLLPLGCHQPTTKAR